MRILSMTATFGKLHHESLTLQPGLNVICKPNEWGKSTWCAFITAMLYGIDTRQQTTKTALADKTRFAPWSGEPMSGRMEIDCNGRAITIERSQKGRIPFGEFRAYETQTGLDVPELTAANCGQVLLGVERSVFVRSGFIRLQDMPVTQDEALRRRLNNLVTTGNENEDGDRLGAVLRDLKNKIRFNRTGLLPQAEAEREQLRTQLDQLQQAEEQERQCADRLLQLEEKLRMLENHRVALRHQTSRQAAENLQQATERQQELAREVEELTALCKDLPEQEQLQQKLTIGQSLLARQKDLQAHTLPDEPEEPAVPAPFHGLTPEQARKQTDKDLKALHILEQKKKKQARLPLWFVLGAVFTAAAAALVGSVSNGNPAVIWGIAGVLIAVGGICLFSVSSRAAKKRQSDIAAICDRYPGLPAKCWEGLATQFAADSTAYQEKCRQYGAVKNVYDAQCKSLQADIAAFAGENTLSQAMDYWQTARSTQQALLEKTRQWQTAQRYAEDLQKLTEPVPAPQQEDTLTLTAQQTDEAIRQTQFEQRTTQQRLGQNQGVAENIGQKSVLRSRLDAISRRISRLEEYYGALEVAQNALYQASTTLQRRFAPRISKKAQQLFSQMTGGRYQRIVMSDDLSLKVAAENEETTRESQWRSDGTVDQLYLSLRLAVAGELTPESPLVLDDALLRFDDERLAQALAVLREESESRQVIVFSCQNREAMQVNQEVSNGN